METRRDAAKKETRSALIRAALKLFHEEGFDGPSLDAICARAGYTRGAFYVHFKDAKISLQRPWLTHSSGLSSV